jgi:hypothetical protein
VQILMLLLCIAGCALLVWAFRLTTWRTSGARGGDVPPASPRPALDDLPPAAWSEWISPRSVLGWWVWLAGLFVCAFVGYYPGHLWRYREVVDERFVPLGLSLVALLGTTSILLLKRSWWVTAILCLVTISCYPVAGCVGFLMSVDFSNPG